jgi:hypothetical protein
MDNFVSTQTFVGSGFYSRRKMLRSSVIALSAGVIPLQSAAVANANEVSSASSTDVYPPSIDLLNYSNDSCAKILAKVTTNSYQPSDLSRAASVISQVSNHFEQTGYGQVVDTVARNTKSPSIDRSALSEGKAGALQLLQKYNPSVASDIFGEVPTLSPDELSAGLENLRKVGFSTYIKISADVLHAASRNGAGSQNVAVARNSVADQHWSIHSKKLLLAEYLDSQIYHPWNASAPRLLRVTNSPPQCASNITPPSTFCSDTANIATDLSTFIANTKTWCAANGMAPDGVYKTTPDDAAYCNLYALVLSTSTHIFLNFVYKLRSWFC